MGVISTPPPTFLQKNVLFGGGGCLSAVMGSTSLIYSLLTCAALHKDWGSRSENILRLRNWGRVLVKSWSGGGMEGWIQLCRRSSWSSLSCLRTYSNKDHLCTSFQDLYCKMDKNAMVVAIYSNKGLTGSIGISYACTGVGREVH